MAFLKTNFKLETIQGEILDSSSLTNKKGLTVFFYWSFQNQPSIRLINDFSNNNYKKLKLKHNVKAKGICIDANWRDSHISPEIFEKLWGIELFFNAKNQFNQEMLLPTVVLKDSQNNVLFEKTDFSSTDIELLENTIAKHAKKRTLGSFMNKCKKQTSNI